MHPAIVKCSLFADLPPAKIEDALRLMEGKVYSYKKGSMMLRVADRVSRFWLVLRGTVHVSLDEADGTHVIMASVSKGGTFGESLCFLGQNAPVYAEAKTDVEVLELCGDFLHVPTTDAFTFLLQQRFTAMLARRALEMNARIQILSKKTMKEKILHLLLHFGGKPNGKPFLLPFDRIGMAFYLGVDRSALSRELSRLQEEGVLTYQKNRFVWLKS